MPQEISKNVVIFFQITLLLVLFVGQAASQTFEPIPGYSCNGTEIITDTLAVCGLRRVFNCSGVITEQFYFAQCISFAGGGSQCRTFGDNYTIDTCNNFQCSRGSTCGNNTYCRTYQISSLSVGCLHNGSCVAENALFSGIFPDCKTYRCEREITFDLGEPTAVGNLCPYGGECRNVGFQYTENCTTSNCSTSGSFNEIAKECSLPNGTCIPDGTNITSSSPCESYFCTVTNNGTLTATLQTVQGCDAFGSCYQNNVEFQDPSNACIKYICNGTSGWYYTEAGCMLPNGTCIAEGTTVSTSPCATYVCTINTTVASAVTTNLETTLGCNVSGVCYQYNQTFDDSTDSCIKYFCNGSNNWYFTETGCSLPNGTCINGGDIVTSTSPCERYNCTVDTSNQSAVTRTLQTSTGCEAFGTCYQETDTFQDPNNTCINYTCNGNNSWAYTDAGCQLQNGSCIADGTTFSTTSPCETNSCSVNTSNPALVTTNLQTVPGCEVFGMCYQSMVEFQDPNNTCIRYICNGSNVWTYTQAGCLLPDGSCVNDSDVVNSTSPCVRYTCSVDTSDPSSVTTNVETVAGCNVSGVCYQNQDVFNDTTENCITYLCNGSNNWYYIDTGCSLTNGTCIDNGVTVTSVTPCETNTCSVNTTIPSSVTATLQTNQGCEAFGMCYQATDSFNDPNNTCITYVCNGSNIWSYTQAECQLPNGSNCLANGSNATSTNPCESYSCTVNAANPSSVVATLQTTQGCEVYGMCYYEMDTFEDPNNTCIKYICNGNSGWTFTEAGCKLPNQTCIQDNENATSSAPCESYSCSVNTSNPSSVIANLQTVAGCNAFGMCVQANSAFQDPSNACIKYICNGGNNWTYTDVGCLLPNLTCIDNGTVVSNSPCATYVCTVDTTNSSSVTANLQTTSGCNVAGTCYQQHDVFNDTAESCIKYICNGSNVWHYIDAGCSLPNGTCVDSGLSTSNTPCATYICVLDILIPSAVTALLVTEPGCEMFGMCYQFGTPFEDPNNICNIYVCTTGGNVISITKGCLLPSGLCVNNGYYVETDNPCLSHNCTVNETIPVTSNLETIMGCSVGGNCYRPGETFKLVQASCIEYICTGNNSWTYTKAECIHPNGTCIPAGDSENAVLCEKYQCNVTTSNPSSVTAELEITEGCIVGGICYDFNAVYTDINYPCVKYRCLGGNNRTIVQAQCSLPNGTCIDNGTIESHDPCLSYHCAVNTSNPSAVIPVLTITIGCSVGGNCYKPGDVFSEVNNSCIMYECKGNNSWMYTKAECKLPNGLCLPDGHNAPHTDPCKEYHCHVNTSNPSAVTTELQIVNGPGCLYGGVCYPPGSIFHDLANVCIKYICLGYNLWTYTMAACFLNGNCLANGQNAPHPDPCKKYHCHVDASNPSAVTTDLQVINAGGCTYNGQCYLIGTIFDDAVNSCVKYKCIGINNWVFIKAKCKLPNGQCLAHNQFAPHPDPCKKYHCHVDKTNPKAVTTNVQVIVVGHCNYGGICYLVGAVFNDIVNSCIKYRCLAANFWRFTQAKCKLPNGQCIAHGATAPHPNPCKKFRCNVDTTNPAAVTSNLQVINAGCVYNGQCHAVGGTFPDAANSCVRYRCIGVNVWIFTKAECKLPNGQCLAANQFAPHLDPCKKYHCHVDTANPSAVTTDLQVISMADCTYGGKCHQTGDIFCHINNPCIKYICLGNNTWNYTKTGCKLPNGQCLEDEGFATGANNCKRYHCHVDKSNPMDVKADLITTNVCLDDKERCRRNGCLDKRNRCRRIGERFRENCHTRRCASVGRIVTVVLRCRHRRRCYRVGRSWNFKRRNGQCIRIRCRRIGRNRTRKIRRRICRDRRGRCRRIGARRFSAFVNGRLRRRCTCLRRGRNRVRYRCRR